MLRSCAAAADGARRGPEDLERLRDALGTAALGLSGREISHLWCLLEGMLHLSNLVFVDEAAEEYVDEHAKASISSVELHRCAALLGLPSLHALLWEAEVRSMTKLPSPPLSQLQPPPQQPPPRASSPAALAAVRRTAAQAATVRRALMEEIHAHVFQLLNGRLNAALARLLSKHQAGGRNAGTAPGPPSGVASMGLPLAPTIIGASSVSRSASGRSLISALACTVARLGVSVPSALLQLSAVARTRML
jgi:hypothetical protein